MKIKEEILNDILISAQTGCVLKLKLRHEKNPVITAVDKVAGNKVVLKPTCLYGYRIKTRTVALPDIETVTRYKTCFDAPLFAQLRFVKNNIGQIRKNMGTPGIAPLASAGN